MSGMMGSISKEFDTLHLDPNLSVAAHRLDSLIEADAYVGEVYSLGYEEALQRFAELFSGAIAAVGEVVPGIARRDRVERVADGGLQRSGGARLGAAQQRLELGERLLDRRAVGRGGGQEAQLAARRFHQLAHRVALVRRHGVEHEDLPRP